MNVKQNLQAIEKLIAISCERTKRKTSTVKIIAVTKYVSVERAKEAISSGIVHLGENRDVGLLEKHDKIGNDASWHFIGSLQTKKVKHIIDKIDYIHSLDRLSLAAEIDKRSAKKIKCFVQINVSKEESKHGVTPEELLEFVKAVEPYPNILIVGLMTMAPFTEDQDLIRSCFRRLSELRNDVQALNLRHAPCTELSMGMSNDFQLAVEEGATFIRLGTSLVGKEF
ncbi:YggS family pyridoxal phosphate-dependent enzyme [Cytobacillus sp. S13-E01]|uniref:YggS family pyridoxal phosphate-dependent enzyme n=1 Tax=Cytobacillus sp. S13-E01 TaxID=3031326 RepID=UPI0023D865D3|nr:YggS family pyridoxal phosphate-dependent enzyme [Cytobacillus sp. S13-E01]MDF0725264.1 YggS family pyridoxal phosphate-dependent enzyme [Cytobacillus sp. S13-E01]